jgi:2-succinyl-5-enolpyruvyl-6-hydroxy-3-cyclohexene-1-carboxylate synthase
MKYSSILLAQSLVAHCETYNIKHVVISPGSRNAPLTIGFTYHGSFECYSIVDERCAAFFALGIAQQLQQPVALVCTSGSALLNYYPAVSEAFFSHIPLVVISADRPEHLVGIGDGQTIYQENVFGRHIFYSANLRSGDTCEQQSNNDNLINQALRTSLEQNGPVHINVPLNEPLYNTTETSLVSVEKKASVQVQHGDLGPQIQRFKTLWANSKRKFILVGVLSPNTLSPEIIHALSEDEALIVFTETTSNLHGPNFFPSVDMMIATLEESEFKELQPEVLLTFGGMVVSKKVKAFLRNFPPKEHWHIGREKANDTFFSLTEHVKTPPQEFLSAVLDSTEEETSAYRDKWLDIKAHRELMHDKYLSSIPFSDFLVFHHILRWLPKNTQVQMGNSSVIRYAQLFQWDSTVSMFCNRGTSGIDGSTSTAIGAAVVSEQPVVLISGDLSFFYDSNALWNKYIPSNFKIILINNQGGGIFRILPGHKNTENFDTYFETTHQLSADHLCLMFGFRYLSANNENELNKELDTFFSIHDQPVLLEIFTPARLNDEILLNYFDFIK